MMVLKGCLGVPVVTSSSDCYIANRMSTMYSDAIWCVFFNIHWAPQHFLTCLNRHNDVGEMVELRGIRWAEFLPTPLPPCTSSACITRRGGVMLRIIFPTKTVWTLSVEAQVVAAARRLMGMLVAAAAGARCSN
jgi:hypothetical protein